jgi:hypothetical protein
MKLINTFGDRFFGFDNYRCWSININDSMNLRFNYSGFNLGFPVEPGKIDLIVKVSSGLLPSFDCNSVSP